MPTIRNVTQNLCGAFIYMYNYIYNTSGLPVAVGLLYSFFGVLLSPMPAAAAIVASSVTVVPVTNANRLKLWQPEVKW